MLCISTRWDASPLLCEEARTAYRWLPVMPDSSEGDATSNPQAAYCAATAAASTRRKQLANRVISCLLQWAHRRRLSTLPRGTFVPTAASPRTRAGGPPRLSSGPPPRCTSRGKLGRNDQPSALRDGLLNEDQNLSESLRARMGRVGEPS